MGNIVLLDELTINKIAAGEVIERPSSVIKEMVENSIDAGANNITVEIQNGGITYIRVTDNGKGILPDDMEFAFERHATSKIRVADDLETVKSMGFRGEALASIAAIANVEMISRTKETPVGYKVVVEAGKFIEREEIGCPLGTTITVRNLFFNTPVRYKFLKKDYTEAGYIEDVVTRLTLANPTVAIKLVINGKVILQTSGNGELDGVVYNIFGRDIAKGLVEVNYTYEDITITGVVGKPEIARSNRSNQIFFVNKRYVKDKSLTAGAEQAYKGLLPIGKFGFIVLNIDIDPKKVDVNVHPAKLEVRFEEEQKVFKAVYHAIKNSLLGDDLVKDTGEKEAPKAETLILEPPVQQKVPKFVDLFKKKVTNEDYTTVKEDNIIEEIYTKKEEKNIESVPEIKTPTEEQVSMATRMISLAKENKEEKQIENDILGKTEPEKKEKIDENLEKQEVIEQAYNEEINQVEEKQNFEEMYAKMFGITPKTIAEQPEKENIEKVEFETENLTIGNNISVFEKQEKYEVIPNYKFIGIAFSTYIIIEMDRELYIIDQHAAHERINYENVKQNFYRDEGKDSQLMLLPDIITLTHKEMDIVRENTALFEKAGFIFEEFGDNTIKLTGVPNICLDLETKELFLEILDEIDTVAITAKQEKEEKFIATIACKASVKAHMALTKEEVDALMKNLLVLPNPFTCPHGRPTAIKMTQYDIERKFNRK